MNNLGKNRDELLFTGDNVSDPLNNVVKKKVKQRAEAVLTSVPSSGTHPLKGSTSDKQHADSHKKKERELKSFAMNKNANNRNNSESCGAGFSNGSVSRHVESKSDQQQQTQHIVNNNQNTTNSNRDNNSDVNQPNVSSRNTTPPTPIENLQEYHDQLKKLEIDDQHLTASVDNLSELLHNFKLLESMPSITDVNVEINKHSTNKLIDIMDSTLKCMEFYMLDENNVIPESMRSTQQRALRIREMKKSLEIDEQNLTASVENLSELSRYNNLLQSMPSITDDNDEINKHSVNKFIDIVDSALKCMDIYMLDENNVISESMRSTDAQLALKIREIKESIVEKLNNIPNLP